MTKVAILGAGSWGSAVAIHLAKCGAKTLLWGRDMKEIIQNNANNKYLPGISFPDNLYPTDDLDLCLNEADCYIVAVPSHAFQDIVDKIYQKKPQINALSWITKGLNPATNNFLSNLVEDKWGKKLPLAIISGPSFAKEVALSLPTALVIAGNNEQYTKRLQQLFHHNTMRAYISDDVIGVQLCGAIKNVLAISTGISDGLKYGANARAALITRGLAEMTKLGKALNACTDTFKGLAGIGDLVLTCTDNQSRNRRFGLLIGEGKSIDESKKIIGQVVEGVGNTLQVCELAKKYNVDMPICNEVYKLLYGEVTPRIAVNNLLSRTAKHES